MACQLMYSGNLSLWDKRACSWAIYDQCKINLDAGNLEELGRLIGQFDELDVPNNEDEKLIYEKFEEIRSKANPGWLFYKAAKEKDKEAKYVEAIEQYGKAKQYFLNDENFANSYGWTIYRRLKELTGVTSPHFTDINLLITEYFSLPITRPSLLHSQIMRLAEKLADFPEFDFLHFVQKWDLNNLRKEDFEDTSYQGKEYSGLAEKTLLQIATELLEKKEYHLLSILMPWLDLAIQKYPDNIWLCYKKAKILIETGLADEAEKYLLPVVKEKRKEFWAWEALGSLYSKADTDLAIACYCKALTCGADEKFLVSTRIDFAELLIKKELFNEARHEIETSVKVREQNGYRIPHDVLRYYTQNWFKQTKATTNNSQLYSNYKEKADELVFGLMPWKQAVVGETIVLGDRKKKFKVIYFRDGVKCLSTLLPENEFTKYGVSKKGAPLEVRVEEDEKGYRILSLRIRENGYEWDIFSREPAVVTGINHTKGQVYVVLTGKRMGMFHAKDFREDYQLCDSLEVVVTTVKDKLKILHVCHSDQAPPSELISVFEGKLKYINLSEIGFAGKVFLDAQMVKRCRELGYTEGENIKVKAVPNFDKKKMVWGWTAVAVL